jgi:proteasome lid subunit RPN8/RPN11
MSKLKKSDLKNDFRDVFIEKHAFKELVASAIEVYNKETNGLLVGWNTFKKVKRENKKVFSVKNVYPLQFEKRKPSEVVHGNVEAFKRVIKANVSLSEKIGGGFHSHPAPYEGVRLSKDDIESIKEDMQEIIKTGNKKIINGWLEILLSIKKKEYKKAVGREWYICDYVKKLRCYVRTEKNIGWDILISAYWVYPKQKVKNGNLQNVKFGVKEVGVYIDWVL